MAAPAAGSLLAAAALVARRPAPEGRAGAFIGWGTFIALAVAVRLALNYGSAVNYFNTYNLFVALSIAAVADRLPARGAGGSAAFAALYLALAIPSEMYNDLNAFVARSRPYRRLRFEVSRRLGETLLDAGPPDGRSSSRSDPRLDALLPGRGRSCR